ncbi:hypothetical protein [Escherichia coli]
MATYGGQFTLTENTTSETQKLVEWFLTPQGQSLVEDVGYVPMDKTLH